jgi:hypothetical protein
MIISVDENQERIALFTSVTPSTGHNAKDWNDHTIRTAGVQGKGGGKADSANMNILFEDGLISRLSIAAESYFEGK